MSLVETFISVKGKNKKQIIQAFNEKAVSKVLNNASLMMSPLALSVCTGKNIPIQWRKSTDIFISSSTAIPIELVNQIIKSLPNKYAEQIKICSFGANGDEGYKYVSGILYKSYIDDEDDLDNEDTEWEKANVAVVKSNGSAKCHHCGKNFKTTSTDHFDQDTREHISCYSQVILELQV